MYDISLYNLKESKEIDSCVDCRIMLSKFFQKFFIDCIKNNQDISDEELLYKLEKIEESDPQLISIRMTLKRTENKPYTIEDKIEYWFLDMETKNFNRYLEMLINFAKEKQRDDICLFIKMFYYGGERNQPDIKILDKTDYKYFSKIFENSLELKKISDFFKKVNEENVDDVYIIIENSDNDYDRSSLIIELIPNYKRKIVTSDEFHDFIKEKYDDNYDLLEYINEYLSEKECELNCEMFEYLINQNKTMKKEDLYNNRK